MQNIRVCIELSDMTGFRRLEIENLWSGSSTSDQTYIFPLNVFNSTRIGSPRSMLIISILHAHIWVLYVYPFFMAYVWRNHEIDTAMLWKNAWATDRALTTQMYDYARMNKYQSISIKSRILSREPSQQCWKIERLISSWLLTKTRKMFRYSVPKTLWDKNTQNHPSMYNLYTHTSRWNEKRIHESDSPLASSTYSYHL